MRQANMAVDGRKLRKSLYQGSDEDHDFQCSPCTKEGKNVAAVKHCVECDENLCKKCLSDHNKFAVMRGHQLLDKVKSPSGKTLELPSQRCERHGKLIDVYCPGHDKVGCSTCMTIEHSGCQGMNFIPDIANNTDTLDKIRLLKACISRLHSRYDDLKQGKQKYWETTKKEKDQLLKEIRSERKKINDQLDKMEAELLQEVDVIFEKKLCHIESNLKEVNATIALLQENLDKVEAAKHENASERYVQINCVNNKIKFAIDYLDDVEKSCKAGKLHFDPYSREIAFKCNIIGSIIYHKGIKVENCYGDFIARIDSDKTTPTITDMCICEESIIVMADYENKRIKKMDESYKIVSFVDVKDNPVGICQIDQSHLAITLINEKRVQFIYLKKPMELKQSFKVGDRCRGIAYKDGMIYVCCGGDRGHKGEGIGHLEVYDVFGQFQTSYHGAIKCPRRLTLSRYTKDIFVTDEYKGILIIDKNNYNKAITVNSRKFCGLRCICWITENKACVAFWESSNILLMSYDGEDQEEILTKKDGKAEPVGLCFDRKSSRLLVSCNLSNTIHVYSLKITD